MSNPLFSKTIKSHPKFEEGNKRSEIEIKFIVPKKEFPENRTEWENHFNTKEKKIEQYYFSEAQFHPILKQFSEIDSTIVDELRVRKKGKKYLLTAKGKISIEERHEQEIFITEQQFNDLKKLTNKSVVKNRLTFTNILAEQEVLVEIDDYLEVAGKKVDLDFVTCEIEVPNTALAKILRSGKFYIKNLLFIRKGLDATGIEAFLNKNLSASGFPEKEYAKIIQYVKIQNLEAISFLLEDVKKNNHENFANIQDLIIPMLNSVNAIDNPPSDEDLKVSGIGASQNILANLQFTRKDSKGSERATDRLSQLDKLGKGWLQDYHTISTSKPFRRIFLKPQVFRVNEGSVDSTTRGTHTLDVISLSQQICKQLGLNVDYTAAMAALHDIGHPPLGHDGEVVLTDLKRLDIASEKYKLPKNKARDLVEAMRTKENLSAYPEDIVKTLKSIQFRHNVFSVSLSEIFQMNILGEVMIGAPLHKTTGRPFRDPELSYRHEEIFALRIADKIAYIPRDIFDAIENGFFKKDQIPDWIYSTLGKTPNDWFETMLDAIVKESAESHGVNFSKKSGKIFEAFEVSREIIYGELHKTISWEQAKLNLRLSYKYNKRVFPNIDPVVVTAYMTDEEVNRLANLTESLPVNYEISENELKSRGFGYLDIIDIMKRPNFDQSRVYYSQVPIDLIEKRIKG